MQREGLKAEGEWEETRGSISGAGAAPASRPNVFFIMIDDLGWNDIGYQSSDLLGITPNLDKLAAGGVKVNRLNITPFRTVLSLSGQNAWNLSHI